MHFDFKFRHLDSSEDLQSYTQERFHKLEKFDLESSHIEVVFSSQKANKKVHVHISGGRYKADAQGESEDFFRAVDIVVDKLAKQLDRSKSRQKSIRRKAG